LGINVVLAAQLDKQPHELDCCDVRMFG